jgi:hypothetical protein
MEISSVQSVIHTLLNKTVLERVFYGIDERTGARVTHSISYTIELYNSKGLIEQSQKGSSVDVRA